MNKYSMNEIFVTNTTVLSWFDKCVELDKSQDLVSRRVTDVGLAEYACAESTLRDYLSGAKPYELLRSLDFFGESPGGKFFNDHMLDYMGNPKWSTSGYDPAGFLGWHLDSEKPGYFIMFSYSKTGQGFLKYLDNSTNTILKIQDKPGWNIRYGCNISWWHCVSSNCPRWTWVYIWDTEEQQKIAISKLNVSLV